MALQEYHVGAYPATVGQKVPESATNERLHGLSTMPTHPPYRSPPPETTDVASVTKAKSLSPPTSRHTPPHSPPRRKSADGEIPIDPELVDAEGEPDTAAPPSDTDPAGPVAHGAERSALDSKWAALGPDELLHAPRPGDEFAIDPTLALHGITPWSLRTSNLNVSETQPPTSASSSPATPVGLGADGLYHDQPFGFSRQSSTTDLGSYVAATKGISTTASSESGFDIGSHEQGVEGDGPAGVPPPKPKKSHARKQPEGHIKRARNAFILFRKHITDSNLIPSSVEVKHQNISVVAAKMWREAPQEVRQKFQEQARIEKEEHQRKYPGYRYQPVFRRTDIIRRRVRKDMAEDEKVEAVAEALIKGKAGGDLEKEIKDQMVARSDASESEADANSSRGGSRRRRREVGQLSKGAIRAQRAQARAKQMRQNLLGSNLLNMSMYNAAAHAAGRGGVLNHPGAQHHLQYAMAESYLPVSYDVDGRPITYEQGMYGGPGMDAGDMYRLPPIDGMGMPYDGAWAGGGGADYWSHGAGPSGEYEGQDGNGADSYYPQVHPGGADFGQDPSAIGHIDQGMPGDFQLPPLMETHSSHQGGKSSQQVDMGGQYGDREKETRDIRMQEWARDGQQTPSGHVMFNERLFDGALGSAGLPALGGEGLGPRDEGLSGFEEAIAQANEVPQW